MTDDELLLLLDLGLFHAKKLRRAKKRIYWCKKNERHRCLLDRVIDVLKKHGWFVDAEYIWRLSVDEEYGRPHMGLLPKRKESQC